VVIKDDTGSIVVTFWGSDVEKINFKQGDIITMFGFLVKEYNGKTLSCTKSSEISLDAP
jgi:ssDNA-binding replication factor A large subunit